MITVLMATRNRCDLLATVLAHYETLTTPLNDWELVIVDNGSTDATKMVVASFQRILPIKYRFEPATGKNRALATGLRYASGSLIVFTDDDILPCRDWLRLYEDASSQLEEFAVFGGPIMAAFPSRVEPWILESQEILGICYACTSPDLTEGEVSRFAFGGNFAIRSDMLRSVVFDPKCGPVTGRSYAMGGETDVQRQLKAAGCRTWWIRRALVAHLIRPEQMQTEWVIRRARSWGRGMHRMSSYERQEITRVFGVPRWAIRSILEHAFGFGWALIRGCLNERRKSQWALNRDLAFVAQDWKQHKSKVVLDNRIGAQRN